MKKIITILSIFFLFFTINAGAFAENLNSNLITYNSYDETDDDNLSFINLVKDGAIKAQSQYGICASLTIAQAALESDWGQSAPGNNLFGIKWTSGCGYDSQILTTKEYVNGEWETIQASFRAYKSLAQSIDDHAKFLLENSRYRNLLGVKDYKTACNLIQQDGYATDPNYSNSLIEIIEEYRLYQYDNQSSNVKPTPQSGNTSSSKSINIVCNATLNVWNESGNVVTQFRNGNKFAAIGMLPPITDGQSGWWKFAYSGQPAWILSGYTSYDSQPSNNTSVSTDNNTPNHKSVDIVCDTTLNVWDEFGNKVTQFHKGDRFAAVGMLPPITDGQSGWWKFNYNGQTTWILSGYTSYVK